MHRKPFAAFSAFFLLVMAWAGSSQLPAADGPRNLIVFFEFIDNANVLDEAVALIFNKMIGPRDQLIIQSPIHRYGFSPKTLSRPKAELIALMQEKLRTDVSRAAQNYKQVMNELEIAARRIADFAYPDMAQSGGIPETRDLSELFIFYRQELANLGRLRMVSDATLRQLTAAFRGQKGENHVIVLFEREFRPVPRREALNALGEMPRFAFLSNELFLTGNTKEPFDVAALIDYYRQVPLTQHFIYVTSKNTSVSGNVLENSGDIYSAFSKIAEATGGISKTIAEPVDGLETVLKAWKEAE